MTPQPEIQHFVRAMVTTIKPELVVKTGTTLDATTLCIAEALKQNGFGRVITCEYDPLVHAAAKAQIESTGLSEWIECRNQSSLELNVSGDIDLLFSDAVMPARERDIRHLLPRLSADGMILMHDASSPPEAVREAALKLEQEGLISVVLLPTAYGLVIAQKREGRAFAGNSPATAADAQPARPADRALGGIIQPY